MHEDDYNDDHIEQDADEEIIIVSKSQLKREAHALLDLAKELVNLPASQYAKIPMPDHIRQDIDEGRRITSHIAKKRQLQHIGKLLRHIDAEPLLAEVEKAKGQDNESRAHFHRLERWRDRLIGEGDAALAEFLDMYPQADRQHLRQLVRNARQEHKANKPPKHSRTLFREIRALAEANGTEN